MKHENAMVPETQCVGRMAELLAASSGASAAAFGKVNVETRRVLDIWSAPEGPAAEDHATMSSKVAADALLAFASTRVFERELVANAPEGGRNLWSFSPKHVVCMGSIDTYPIMHFVVFLFENGAARDTENIRNLARIGVNFVGTLAPNTGVTAIEAEIPSTISQSVLKCLSFGYIVLDARGHIRALKDSADGWLKSTTAFEVQGDRLIARRQKDRQILSDAIEAASDGRRKVSVLLLDRTQAVAKETVYVMPIDGSDGLVLVTFGQGSSDREIRDLALDAMGLTAAERRVTQNLMEGKSLQEAADEANLTISTARSYLKSIFQKTGMRSQSQLVTLCLNLTPAISTNASDQTASSDDARLSLHHAETIT